MNTLTLKWFYDSSFYENYQKYLFFSEIIDKFLVKYYKKNEMCLSINIFPIKII